MPDYLIILYNSDMIEITKKFTNNEQTYTGELFDIDRVNYDVRNVFSIWLSAVKGFETEVKNGKVVPVPVLSGGAIGASLSVEDMREFLHKTGAENTQALEGTCAYVLFEGSGRLGAHSQGIANLSGDMFPY